MSVAGKQRTGTLFPLEELEDPSKTGELAASDLEALRAVADWIERFVARPNDQLGRPGPVCPFVPDALARHTLWLAAEHVACLSAADAADLVTAYERRFQEVEPSAGEVAIYKAFVVVLTDLRPDRAGEFLGGILDRLAAPAYEQDGFVLGGFYEGNEGTAIYNASFRPFTSPVPFLLLRQAVVGDWKFFLDKEDWLGLWARRYGASGAEALAEALRGLPWRQRGSA
jgi:hypothetical protein